MRIQLILFLSLALAGATALAWHQWRELTELRAVGLAGGDQSGLQAEIAALQARNRALQDELAAALAGRDAAATAGVPGDSGSEEGMSNAVALLERLAGIAAADGPGGSRRDEDLELLAAMADLPEFQRMLALQQRGRVEEKYADLFRKLKLTPGELARLQTLLGDRQGAFADAMMAARAQGLTGHEARELAGKVARTTQKEITESIKSLLGPEQFNRLQSYERTAPQRTAVDQLADRLSYTTDPLTPRQQERLVQTLANTDVRKATRTVNAAARAAGEPVTKTKATESIAALPGSVAGLGIDNGRSVAITSDAIERAGAFLSPSQVAALKRMQQEQQAQQAIGNLLRTGTVVAPAKEPKLPKVQKPGG